MRIIALIIIINIAFLNLLNAQKTGAWGDQGNGTYKNPILEANYPDNDVIRQGNTFYMMSGTSHFTPGIIILKSIDLVNWEFSNYIIPAPITFDKIFDLGVEPFANSLATWAGSLGFDGKNYYAYWCNNNKNVPGKGYKIVYSKAKTMEGPWSEPKEITWADGTSINSTDPGVMWDLQTQKAWMACCDSEVYEMSWDGSKLLQNRGEGTLVSKKLRGESAKLYKFDDWYYLMNTITPTSDRREQVIHRARNMNGPWEGRVILENGNGTNRCPSQGTLLKLDDGSWWFIHQLARGLPAERYNGRPQMLQPVEWKDGWPFIGVDTDGNGIGEVVWEHKKPNLESPITAPATDDDFEKPALGLQWYWRYNPRMDRWSLTERRGYLRLKSCVPVKNDKSDNLKYLQNYISQRVMGRHRNVATAKFDVDGMANNQEVGLHVSSDYNNIIGVKKDNDGNLNLFFKTDNGVNVNTLKGITLKQNDLLLQIKIENGFARFYFSLDSKNFTQLGKQVQLFFTGHTANGIGFYSMNSEENGYVDIDWFTYDYDGPKGR